MPRFEDATHFWEIVQTGATVETRTGKLGARGRASAKRYATVGDAARAFAEACKARREAGCTLVEDGDPAVAPAVPPAETVAFEQAIAADPYDAAAYAVYGDALQRQGDPRGELIALQLAAEREPASTSIKQAVAKLLAANVAAFLGPLAAYVADVRAPDRPPFRWRYGFIHRVELHDAKGLDPAALLAQLFAHPSGRFVAELAVSHARPASVVDVLARACPPALRKLELSSRGRFDSLEPLWPALAHVEHLDLMAPAFELGAFALASARRARFVALETPTSVVVAIAHAPWPHLERLELALHHTDADFVDLKPLLLRDDLPALTHLRLRGAAFAGAILRTLIHTPIGRKLHVLDLSHGEINPGDVDRLVRNPGAFPELREIWLPLDRLRPQDREALRAVAQHVVSDRRAPRDPFEQPTHDGSTDFLARRD